MKSRVRSAIAGALRRARPWAPAVPLDLDYLARNIDRVPFHHSLTGIGGWLTDRERRALYALGRYLPGPVLEIGSFVGLSTACIALGIRDGGTKKHFVTVDRFPGLENFRPIDGGVGWFEPKDAVEEFATISTEMYEGDFLPQLRRPGGLLGTLRSNLSDQGVRDLVQIVRADFRDLRPRPYAFIFSDALHDVREIEMNASAMRDLVRPGSILACHDTSPKNEARLRACLPLGKSIVIDLLLVAEVT